MITHQSFLKLAIGALVAMSATGTVADEVSPDRGKKERESGDCHLHGRKRRFLALHRRGHRRAPTGILNPHTMQQSSG